MKDDKRMLSKDELKKKLDELGDEIKYRVAEARKSDDSVAGAHKTDIAELIKNKPNNFIRKTQNHTLLYSLLIK